MSLPYPHLDINTISFIQWCISFDIYLQIDLKSADPDSVSKQMKKLFDITQDEVLKVTTFWLEDEWNNVVLCLINK